MFWVFLALTVLVPTAEPLDKEQIRRNLSLPACESETTLGFDSNGRLLLPDSDAFLAEECAVAERSVQANPADPERYRVLSQLYSRMNEIPKAKAAAAKAAELYQVALSKRPADGLALALKQASADSFRV